MSVVFKRTVLLLVMALQLVIVQASKASSSFPIDLESCTSIFLDSSSELNLAEISTPDYLFRFSPWKKERLYFTAKQGTAWLRVNLPEDLGSNPLPVLKLIPPPGVAPQVYVVSESASKALTISQISKTSTQLYNLEPYINESFKVFIKLPASAADGLQLSLNSPSNILASQEIENWQTGSLLSFFFAIIIFNLSIWARRHHHVYLLLALTSFTGLIFLSSWQGILNHFMLGAERYSYQIMNTALLLGSSVLSLGASLFLCQNNRFAKAAFICLGLLNFTTLMLSFMGLPVTLEQSLVSTAVAMTCTWTYNLFTKTSGSMSPPPWLTAPMLIVQIVSTFAILGILSINPLSAMWGILHTTAVTVLAISIYYSKHSRLKIYKVDTSSSEQKQMQKEQKQQQVNSIFDAMGHELRTPLNGVTGMAELLQSTQLTPKQQQYLQTLQYAGTELGNLINLLSDAWKSNSQEGYTPELKPYDVNTLLSDALQPFQIRAEQLQTELISFIHPDVPEYSQTDTRRLSLILEGVLTHAFSQMAQGELMVSINHTQLLPMSESGKLTRRSREDGYLLFQISYSNHHGLTLPDLNSKTSYHEAKSESDISLNLYIAIQFIESMGGQVGHMNQGNSHIWFAIPHNQYQNQNPALQPEQSWTQEGLKALIVDDNKTCRQVLAQQCALIGLSTTEAEGGREALAMIRNESYLDRPFDVIILDYHMPGMNGLQMLERLNESNRKLPKIIMLTGATTLLSKQRAEKLGISAFLTKPASRFDLQKALSQSLTETEPEPETESQPW